MRELVPIRKTITARGIGGSYIVGYGCSECAWTFSADRLRKGNTLWEIVENFEKDEAEAFREHDCAKYPPKGSRSS